MAVAILTLIIAVVLYSTLWVGVTTASFLILLVLYATGTVEVGNLFTNMVNSSTILVVFMFILNGAMIKSGASSLVGKCISYHVKTERGAMFRLFLVSMAISALFSNMATATVTAAFAEGIVAERKEFRLQKLIMGVAVGSILGGMLTIVGVSGNVMVRTFLEEAGAGTVGFWDFGKIGLPLCLAGSVFMYTIGYRLSPGRENAQVRDDGGMRQVTDRKSCVLTIVVFAGVIISMMLETVTKIPLHISAFVGCTILLFGGVVNEKEIFSFVNWPTTIMFATLLTLGGAIAQSGAAQILAEGLLRVVGEHANKTLVLTVLFVVVIVLTQFMSNGATTAAFYPVGLVIAKSIDASPVAVLMMICVAASCSFATPMATPLNAYLMTVADYRFSDFVKIGIPLMVISALTAVLLCPVIWKV